jgi:tetratricopeptide (TPR) repeat protein
MKNIIINLTLILVIAMSLMLSGCSANYMIAENTEDIEEDPRDDEAYRERALAWEEKRDYDRAIADYTKAIEIDPANAEPYYFRALVWEDKGDYDRALADCSTGLKLTDISHLNEYFIETQKRLKKKRSQ